MIEYLLFAVGFALILNGADVLVDGSSMLAKKIGIPDLVVGLTLVAFGTSMPEFVINLFANHQGSTQIAIGNIIGANILDILVVLGVSTLIYPLAVSKDTGLKEILLSLLSALLLGILVNDQLINSHETPMLDRSDGMILLFSFIIFLLVVVGIAKVEHHHRCGVSSEIESGFLKIFLMVLVGFIFLSIGARWVVNGAVYMATALGVSQSLIALTIVSLGTTMPEMTASTVAAFKKRPGIAVGNVIGSTIFNTFFILGVSSLLNPIPYNTVNNFDIGMLILANIILIAAVFLGNRGFKLERWEGVAFILAYLIYLAFLIVRR